MNRLLQENPLPQFWWVCHLGQFEKVEEYVCLLMNYDISIDSKDIKGQTALHIATRAGKLQIVKLLIEHGANINSISHDKLSPCYIATKYGKIEILQYLINEGCDVSVITNIGTTALDTAKFNDKKLKATFEILQKISKAHVKLENRNLERCTYAVTKNVCSEQHYYNCNTCNIIDTSGICIKCARVCHSGHDIEYGNYDLFFCDCHVKFSNCQGK